MLFSLYIHIPFCIKKCYYCDFVSYPFEEFKVGEYMKALVKELELNKGYQLKTVYIGGGTPTCIPVEYLELLFSKVYRYYNVEECSEITVEANPGTLSPRVLAILKRAGVNRLSIGLQSWHKSELQRLGRIHDASDFVKNYLEARKAGFDNISVDLMFGIPGQTVESWMATIKELVALQPEHISCYSLKIEEGTPFYNLMEEGRLQEVDQDTDREMYRRAAEYLECNGYQRYEISNFSRRGFRCSHNLTYWNNRPYLGIGAGAHSRTGSTRSWNTSSLERYCSLLERGIKPVEGSEHITREMEIFETIILGLRLAEGISFNDFRERFGVDLRDLYRKQIDKLRDQGLLRVTQNSIYLTPYGIDISNRVFQEFLP